MLRFSRVAFAVLLILLILLCWSRRASAEPPAWVTSAIVDVDAYEHRVRGIAIGDGRTLVVPFAAIEVDRPGGPDAYVLDAHGKHVDAKLIATDREAGVALLQIATPVTAKPLSLRAMPLTAGGLFVPCDGSWTPFVAQISRAYDREEIVWSGSGNLAEGAPIVDEEGHLVGVMGVHGLGGFPPLSVAAAVARMESGQLPPERRAFIFYFGIAFETEASAAGGLWLGTKSSFGGRWRDLVEARLDVGESMLMPAGESCTRLPCIGGGRLVATPSIGARLRLGGIDGLRKTSIAITPSIGWALGLQSVSRDPGGSAADVAAKSSWDAFAPGVTLSVGRFEISARARIPHEERVLPTLELALFGVYL